MSKNSSATISNASHILTLAVQKGLTEEGFDVLNTGFLADLFEAAVVGKLKTVDREAVRKVYGLPSLVPPILELVKEFDCPATEAFNLDDFFTLDNPTVKFGWIDGDMKKYFKNRSIVAEGPRKLVVNRLVRNATEKELKVVAPQKTTWADLKWELEQQPNGESGNLLTNGRANLRFIGDCLVYVYWYDYGWYVYVNPVNESHEWLDGIQLVSRN